MSTRRIPIIRPATEREKFVARVNRHAEVLERERAKTREAQEATVRAQDERDAARIAAIVAKRTAGRTDAVAKQIEDFVERRRREWSPRPDQRTFPLYDVISEAESKFVAGVLPPPRRPAMPAPLPPPRNRAEAERMRAEAVARGDALMLQRQQEREAFERHLKARGLAHPSWPIPGMVTPGKLTR
ncbi:MAG TPA: hypothetical protein VMI54_03815 [Polyangiaceae bacterium]|nr:hypothetical protein [Polyangiaceae bacterium]